MDEMSDTAPPLMTRSLGRKENENTEVEFASMTPEKTAEPAQKKHEEETVYVPEKYEIIAECFSAMISSVRLLGLCKKVPTFENITIQVKILAKREFSYKHLSQIMHIVPEVISLDKILVHDKKTLCMKPELKVSLKLDQVTEGHQNLSPFLILRNTFTSRLQQCVRMLTEGSEIPEAVLPEPFASGIHGTESSLSFASFSAQSEDAIIEKSPTPIRRFTEKTTVRNCSPEPHNSPVSPSLSPTHGTISFHDKSRLDTPALMTPKRSVPTGNEKLKPTVVNQNTPYSHVKRSLDFSDVEGNLGLHEKVQSGSVIQENRIPVTSSLKLASLVSVIFKSSKRSSITKEELVHKIIMHDLDAVDRGEVEEGLHVLEKVVPEWIWRTSTSSGDTLYRIRGTCSSKYVQDRISGAL